MFNLETFTCYHTDGIVPPMCSVMLAFPSKPFIIASTLFATWSCTTVQTLSVIFHLSAASCSWQAILAPVCLSEYPYVSKTNSCKLQFRSTKWTVTIIYASMATLVQISVVRDKPTASFANFSLSFCTPKLLTVNHSCKVLSTWYFANWFKVIY